MKTKLEFEDYKNYLKVTKLKNKINQIEKSKDYKDHNSILKSQHRVRWRKHNVFAEEVNNIARIANNDKRIQSIDSTETYVQRTNKDLICKKLKNVTI